jgi:hypothetical protein
MELIDMDSRYSFSDGEGPTKNGRSVTPMSDLSSADERHQHHRVLQPIPPLPTWPSVLAAPSVPVTMALGIYDDDHTCYSYERRRDAAESY